MTEDDSERDWLDEEERESLIRLRREATDVDGGVREYLIFDLPVSIRVADDGRVAVGIHLGAPKHRHSIVKQQLWSAGLRTDESDSPSDLDAIMQLTMSDVDAVAAALDRAGWGETRWLEVR